MLTDRGHLDEAARLIERAIPLTPAHYPGPLAAQLCGSVLSALQTLEQRIR